MDTSLKQTYSELWQGDDTTRYNALITMMQRTDQPVDWAYEVWDDLITKLKDQDNHVRARAAQLLCNLAKSDPKGRMSKNLERVMIVTHDPRFVTARHTLQNVWKVGLAGTKQRRLVLNALAARFEDASTEKNCTLVRYDIEVGLRHLFDATSDAAVRKLALELAKRETDLKYQKKYLGAWRGT